MSLAINSNITRDVRYSPIPCSDNLSLQLFCAGRKILHGQLETRDKNLGKKRKNAALRLTLSLRFELENSPGWTQKSRFL